jgi:hypothetical protein
MIVILFLYTILKTNGTVNKFGNEKGNNEELDVKNYLIC